jgi:hypothetical protein
MRVENAPSSWSPLLDFPYDYPEGPLLVAAADRATGEVAFFVCNEGGHGQFYPCRWGPQDQRLGMQWCWLQETGWTPFAWSASLPDYPSWPLPPTQGDMTDD